MNLKIKDLDAPQLIMVQESLIPSQSEDCSVFAYNIDKTFVKHVIKEETLSENEQPSHSYTLTQLSKLNS